MGREEEVSVNCDRGNKNRLGGVKKKKKPK